MENGSLIFIGIALVMAVGMLVVSWVVRRAAQRQMPGRRDRGTHWIGDPRRHDDDFDGDGL